MSGGAGLDIDGAAVIVVAGPIGAVVGKVGPVNKMMRLGVDAVDKELVPSVSPKVYLPNNAPGGGEVQYTYSDGTVVNTSDYQFIDDKEHAAAQFVGLVAVECGPSALDAEGNHAGTAARQIFLRQSVAGIPLQGGVVHEINLLLLPVCKRKGKSLYQEDSK